MTQLRKKSKRYADIIAKAFGVIIGLIILSLTTSCATFKLSTMYHDPLYGPEEVVLDVPADVTIDTLSYSQLRWKLRTDSRFRWDFAQYAMDQPYSWYTSNYSFSYWRPYTSFDIYWNRYQFWNDWAFNYPFFNYGWGYNSWGWNTHNYGWYSWNRPYRPWNGHWNSWYNGPWSNPSYNVIWNSSRENVAYINGPRGSRGGTNSNIQNSIVTRYNQGRNIRSIDNNNENSTINTIISNLKERFDNVRVYTKPTNNGRPVINNNGRPVINNNNNSNIRFTPRINPNNNNNSYKPVNNTSTRPSYNISRGGSSSVGSSRGGSSSSSGTSGGSSRGGVKNN